MGNTPSWNRTRDTRLEGAGYLRLTKGVGGGGTYLYPQLKGQLSIGTSVQRQRMSALLRLLIRAAQRAQPLTVSLTPLTTVLFGHTEARGSILANGDDRL